MRSSIDTTLAFVPIARPTFDVDLAQQVTAEVLAHLKAAGLKVIGPAALISDLTELRAMVLRLAENPPDLVLVLQATFADNSLVMELAQTVDSPLLLWAVPEARTGDRLRLNSLCGINLAGHGLTRAGYRYDYIYASPDDEAALSKVKVTLQAAAVRRRLSRVRLGRIGQHPAGFDTCRYDQAALKTQFGVDLVEFELAQVFEGVRTIESSEIADINHELSQTLGNLSELDQAGVQGTLGTYLTLQRLADRAHLDGFAIRCWPEFFTELGCAACGAMSMLSNELTPCSCEADVNGTLTQLVLQWLSGEPAFGSDLVSVDTVENLVVLWHCGLAPLSMADPATAPRGTIHSNRQLPLQMEFSLKPGRVTVARLSEASGSYRLVVAGGEIVQAPPSFTGTSGAVRFDRPAVDVLDTIMTEGLEHHYSLTYGDHVPALLTLASMLDLPVLRLA
jgi:L-fucose isomerase-like protein